MDSMIEFATRNIAAIGFFAATALVLMAYIASNRFQFWVTDFWVTFPFIGPMARLSKDITHGANGWLRAEESLCGKYKTYCNLLPRDLFNERTEYLRKAADLGRTPTPFWVLSLLVILVIAEGLGFSYLLGTWMAREGSANTHTLLMFAIVLVLCVILVAITHFAGKQFYRTSLLRSCFKRFKERGGDDYAVRRVKLDEHQSLDDNAPEFKQIINRVAQHSHDKGSYAGMVIAVITIISIAVISTYMRMQNLENEILRETTLAEQSAGADASSGNPFGNLTLPAEVRQAQQQADNQAKKEATNALKSEGMAAFAILAVIFTVTQIVGIGAGYTYGFAGQESKDAYRELGGFSTYESYLAHYRPRRDLANSRLKDLQQRLEESSHTPLSLTRTFDDYLYEQRVKEAQDSHDPKTHNPPAAPVNTAPSGQTSPTTNTAAPVLTLDAIKAEIERLNNAEAEKAYFLTLPATLRANAELQAWLKQRKSDREAAAAAEKVDADELF